MPLRVCFYAFFPGGGIGRYTDELATAMNRLPDVEVEVACSPDYEWRDTDAYRVWTGLQSLSHPVPTLRRARFLKGQFVNPLRFVARAKQTGADIVHFSNINHLTFPIWRGALQRSGIAVAATAHDVRRKKRMISRTWEDRQLKAFYRFADALFVHSEYQADELIKWAGVDSARVHVVPHGPYPHGAQRRSREVVRAELDLPQEACVALFFGQIRDDKNLDGFIQALRYTRDRVYCIVAGKPNTRHREVDYYRQLVRKGGLEDRVRFVVRHIGDDEVGELFAAADFAALPYHDSFTSQSGVLNVAVHYERPVLVSSAPVLSETVRQSGIGVICEGTDPQSLARGIDEISRLPLSEWNGAFDAYRSMYSWKQNGSSTIQVYDEVCR